MISYKDEDHQMPPKGKLPQKEIDLLTRWVGLGLPWTPSEANKLVADPHGEEENFFEKAASFWSYQPLTKPSVPDADEKTTPIDAFLLKDLTAKGLTPNKRADKRTLIRRATYDLTGLAPSPEDVEAFLQDDSKDAWPKLVDRLLDSPHYGEKWARHWLDLVRYAESNGFERDSDKNHIWRYRDYVIKAFNEDKPYDQFILEQLAGDELDEVTTDSLIATGYHRLMQWDDEPADRLQHVFDVLDDNVRVTTETFLGATLGCARCHDHKGDPYSQEDYFRFVSFFNNVTQMDKGRVIELVHKKEGQVLRGRGDRKRKIEDLRKRIERVEKKGRELLVKKDPTLENILSGGKGEALIADSRNQPQEWYYTTTQPAEDWSTVGFRADQEGWAKGKAGFGGSVPNAKGRTGWNGKAIWLQKAFALTEVPKSLRLTIYHDEDVAVYLNGTEVFRRSGYVTNYVEHVLPKEAVAALQTGRNVVAVHCIQTGGGQFIDLGLADNGERRPIAEVLAERGADVLPEKEFARYQGWLAELKEVLASEDLGEGLPVMIVQEHGPDPREQHVHIRGNANARGKKVMPGYPVIFKSKDPQIAKPAAGAKTSGKRRQLAEWIASKENPRTARVMVNRLWQHHFGRGICPTPNDFGFLGEKATQSSNSGW
ncbi:MAG: DUF1549 domain-containing protein, partial [Verrucomicrobiota bacterium]